jgi:hypothetical protein
MAGFDQGEAAVQLSQVGVAVSSLSSSLHEVKTNTDRATIKKPNSSFLIIQLI